MTSEFSEKIVVVTGGSRGIGYAIAAAFAHAGAQTVLAASSRDNLEAAADAIAAAGGKKPFVVAGDLRRQEAAEQLFEAVRGRYGRCDVLINAAGAARSGTFFQLTDEDFRDGFALKFFAAVALCRLFWPLLKESRGAIVNIAGNNARTPDIDSLIGGSVSAALANVSKGLAGLGNRDDVNVNVIHPGATDTDRMRAMFAQRAAAAGTTPEDVRAAVLQRDGVRRIGLPEDIAELALFLCSRQARYIQGVAISVDGGANRGV
ncbi:MAG: SDR family oxidoreductase [Pseudorhodoplanes sp.]